MRLFGIHQITPALAPRLVTGQVAVVSYLLSSIAASTWCFISSQCISLCFFLSLQTRIAFPSSTSTSQKCGGTGLVLRKSRIGLLNINAPPQFIYSSIIFFVLCVSLTWAFDSRICLYSFSSSCFLKALFQSLTSHSARFLKYSLIRIVLTFCIKHWDIFIVS